jgi:hypothetical protein
MLLAKHKPLAGFRKSVPLAAAGVPKARGFGPRKKVVALARKSAPLGLIRVGSPLSDGFADEAGFAPSPEMVAAPEPLDEESAVGWVKDIDWGGIPIPSPESPPHANGHDHSAGLVEGLPVAAALPPMTPEVRALN